MEIETEERGIQFVSYETDAKRYTASYMRERAGEVKLANASSMYYLLKGTYSVEQVSEEVMDTSQDM